MFKSSPATIPAAGAALFGIVVCLAPAMTPGPLAQAQQPAAAQGAGRSGRGDGAAPPAPVDPKQLLQGTDEDDTIKGGNGDDWLFGKKGNDWLVGGGGRDAIDGFEGDDTIDGGGDADIIDGGAGSDTIRGGEGDDTVDAGDEDDTIDGGDGNDDLDGGDGNDTLRGGAGNDRLAGGDENDMLNGGAGTDRLAGEDGDDMLLGGPGDDLLFGGGDDDTLDGEAGDDRVDGGEGNDFVRGGQGNDVLLGSSGRDMLQGGAGHDVLLGGDDDDVIDGDIGSDFVLPGGGADVVASGDGDDLVVVRAADVPAGELETINGGRGTDTLILNGFTRRLAAGAGDITDPVTGGTYGVRNVEATEFTQLLTTTTGGAANVPASLLLVNPSPEAAGGRMLVYGADGAVVPVAAGGAPARDVVTFTVPALGSLRLDGLPAAPATVQIFSSVPLGSLLDSGSMRVSESAIVDSALVPVVEDARSGLTTGVVLTGSIAATNVNLSLHRTNGEEIDGETFSGAREVALAPYAQTTLYVRDLFPALGDFRGSLSIDADPSRAQEGGPVTVTALERGAGGRVAAAPALPLLVSAPAGGRVFLPHVTAGGGATTTIVLTNALRARPAQGTLRFFDESGNPWLIGVNGQPPTATVPFDLEPQGTLVVTLPDAGPLRRGSAQAEPAQGRVGAAMRHTSAIGALQAGSVAAGLIAAVRRDPARGTTTRVAVSSTGSDAALTFTLRTASGTEVPGATAALRVPANGHMVRTIEELFPGAPAGAFEGTLTIAADGGTIAAAVVELQTATGEVTLLPVTEMD